MNDSNNPGHVIDARRSAHLWDVGDMDHIAATVVKPDGDSNYILADVDLINSDEGYQAACSHAPHEQCGALPELWQARVDFAPLRCSHRGEDGRQCPNVVHRFGALCGWHLTPTCVITHIQKA